VINEQRAEQSAESAEIELSQAEDHQEKVIAKHHMMQAKQ
jgi:hypothetical protein